MLDENTSNKIAAGEVVEKPASVVKELVENSIDAGATSISIEIRNGGISLIKITDNGCGMEEDDVEIAFERHATSKIKRAEDLDSIVTMGFRGEALASIASVSSVELQTKTAKSTYGMYVHIRGGVFQEIRPTGCPDGTTFVIKDLFFNTPARYKFLKKDSTEAGYISDTISRIALGNPDISFKLASGKTQLIHTPGNNDLKSAIYSIYGKDILRDLLPVEYRDDKLKISGYIGKPESARSNRNYQSLYINKRYVKSRLVSYAVEQAFSSILMKNKFPFFVLNIDINPVLVDANVHPAKTEVRFADESYLTRTIYIAVSNALSSGQLFNPVSVSNKDRELFKFDKSLSPQDFVQKELDLGHKVGISNHYDKKADDIKQGDKKDEIRLFSKALEPLANPDLRKTGTIPESEYKEDTGLEDGNESMALSRDDQKEMTYTYETESEKVLCSRESSLPDTKNLSDEDGKHNRFYPISVEQACTEMEPAGSEGKAALSPQELNSHFTSYKNLDSQSIIEKSDPILSNEDRRKEDTAEVFHVSGDAVTEQEEKSDLPGLVDMKYIGQAFSTYIILQNGEELVMIDQHAAHERILYEKLRAKYDSQENTTQLLLEPVVVKLQPFELASIKAKEELLSRIGFVFEDFGNNSIIMRGIPYMVSDCSPRDIFFELTEKLQDAVKPVNTPLADEIIHTIACKAAVKANKRLDEKEVHQLLEDLSRTGRRYTCPHGRPTIIRLTKYEIEKMFKRIV